NSEHPFGMLSAGGSKEASRQLQSLDKEVLAPHHRLIHSKILVYVIDAATQNSLPSIIPGSEIPVGRQRPHCPQRGLAVRQASGSVSRMSRKIDETGGSDRRGAGVDQALACISGFRRIEVPGRETIVSNVGQPVVGLGLRDPQETRSSG